MTTEGVRVSWTSTDVIRYWAEIGTVLNVKTTTKLSCNPSLLPVSAWRLMESYSILLIMDFSPTFYGLPKPLSLCGSMVLLSFISTILSTMYYSVLCFVMIGGSAWRLMESYSILVDFSPTFYGLPKPLSLCGSMVLLSFISTILSTMYYSVYVLL